MDKNIDMYVYTNDINSNLMCTHTTKCIFFLNGKFGKYVDVFIVSYMYPPPYITKGSINSCFVLVNYSDTAE
jgi:hypothetical protein